MEGHAIPTIGYRGMHSYTVTFNNYFVPATHRVGAEGQGFKLQMAGFAGGRIQTASRAVGLMEAAFRKAVTYTVDRTVFGRPLALFSLPQYRLLTMAARIPITRRMSRIIEIEPALRVSPSASMSEVARVNNLPVNCLSRCD